MTSAPNRETTYMYEIRDFLEEDPFIFVRDGNRGARIKFDNSSETKHWAQEQSVIPFALFSADERDLIAQITAESVAPENLAKINKNDMRLDRAQKQAVEIGKYRIVFKDGSKFIHTITSHKPFAITAEDDTLVNALKLKGLSFADIESVQFFHNHPSEHNSPVTIQDVNIARMIHNELNHLGAKDFKFYIYAFQNVMSEIIVYNVELE